MQLHAFNFTDRPLVREAWLNLYFPQRTPSELARPARLTGGVDWVIAPSDERTVSVELSDDGEHDYRLLAD